MNSSTPGIDLEAKPGDLVAVVSKSGPGGDASESWLCRAHDGRQGFLPLTSLEIVRKRVQPQAQIQDGVVANTMTTRAVTRANLLISNAVKQLDHSGQTGLPIRNYLSDLDFDGSEQDPGQWSEVNRMIPTNLSFYVRIEPLSPDYSGQPICHGQGGHWVPPMRPNGLTNGQGPALLLRWEGGEINIVPANDPIRGIDFNRYVYRAATIFTQYPDTPHLLVVPFDARTRSVQLFGRGWHRIAFDHLQVAKSNRDTHYSYTSDQGAEQRIAAPGSPQRMPQLLPPSYDCNPRHAARSHAGLIGQLSLLFALAAFSAPPTSLEMLSSSMRPGKWMPHGFSTGGK